MFITTYLHPTSMEQGEKCVMNVVTKFIIKMYLRIKMLFLSSNMGKIVKRTKRWERPKVKIKGEILSEWIDASPLSKSDIAELLGCTRRTINRWIAETRSPRSNDQRKIVQLTGLNFWELFEER